MLKKTVEFAANPASARVTFARRGHTLVGEVNIPQMRSDAPSQRVVEPVDYAELTEVLSAEEVELLDRVFGKLLADAVLKMGYGPPPQKPTDG